MFFSDLSLLKEFLKLKKQNKELKLQSQELEDLSHTVAHDLKAPIRTMSSFAQLLKKNLEGKDEKITELADFIIKSSDKTNHLLESMIEFARLNTATPIKTDVVLEDVLDEVKLNLYSDILEHKVKIISRNLPVVSFHKFQMIQVLQNLVSNAIKYNDKETPIIEITADENEKEYIIYIKDNGLGFEEKFKDKLFKPFERLHSINYEGSGVGLATCKKIIETNGGRIDVFTKLGEGSTFYFTVPKNKKSRNFENKWHSAS